MAFDRVINRDASRLLVARSPEGDIITIEGLNHTSPGSITQAKKTYLPWVTYQRYASYAFSAIALPALTYAAWLLVKAKQKEKPLEEVVKPYGEIIAEAGEPSYEGRQP